jgi:hypothetical protein
MRSRFAPLLLLLPLLTVSAVCAAADSGPRNGKYLIMSYGAPSRPPLHLGYFVLDGGKYKAYLPGDRLSGSGEWQYDGAEKTVIWKSGPYAGVWGGKFEVDRGGKTHNLRMKRSTIGTNSTD